MSKPKPNKEEYLDLVGQKLSVGNIVVWVYKNYDKNKIEFIISVIHSFSGTKVRLCCYNEEIDEFENTIRLANDCKLIKVSHTDIDGIYIDAKERLLKGTNTGI